MIDKPESREIVLVVDDSPETLGFLTEAMEASGVTVLVARSGESALGIAGKVVPDIILMDAVMPGLDGFETCVRLKQMADVAHVPIIFMTGLTETEHVVHALESGGVDYLTKPINIDELRARIRVHLANARSAQSARVALDAAGRHLMAVATGGELLWTTPQASRLLDTLQPLGAGSRHVADRASGWIGETTAPESRVGESFSIESPAARGLQLLYLGTIGNNEHLFRLIATSGENQDNLLRQIFGLTQRESEVLLWIARGKSNRDIGDILGLSPRTVNKHLEQVYTKLGVENRASAAIKATHALQPLEG
jgi:DNA-binding NarL/FixJ family response regulator